MGEGVVDKVEEGEVPSEELLRDAEGRTIPMRASLSRVFCT